MILRPGDEGYVDFRFSTSNQNNKRLVELLHPEVGFLTTIYGSVPRNRVDRPDHKYVFTAVVGGDLVLVCGETLEQVADELRPAEAEALLAEAPRREAGQPYYARELRERAAKLLELHGTRG